MFEKQTEKQLHWDSALRRFAGMTDIQKLAESVAINPQTLRNKLNPAQPHELTVVEMLRITHVTGDYSLLDGLLAQLGRLPSMKMADKADCCDFPECILQITAATGTLANETVQLMADNRLSKRQKDTMVTQVNKAVQNLAMFAYSIEERFHSISELPPIFKKIPMTISKPNILPI
ncbi:phage regulatory CII family protein [Yersinia enterocolitica]|uniref:phage regulatory CII family protein n=1 Tax=Yersinia enterocolitica TaxID=630 RepID=UPI000DA0F668|nr:phage regulatory CII family protein [Yersinia enterocolitica]SQA35837.1 regulatory CII family protein [Yersinia enterocolitica]SUP63132.1 regulatory CII family protein [Yersinia enterocolitica]